MSELSSNYKLLNLLTFIPFNLYFFIMGIRVAIFDVNQSLRFGLYQLINGSEGFTCVGAYENCKTVLRDIKDCSPDTVSIEMFNSLARIL